MLILLIFDPSTQLRLFCHIVVTPKSSFGSDLDVLSLCCIVSIMLGFGDWLEEARGSSKLFKF